MNDDKTTEIGSPSISGATVEAKLLDNVKDRTVLVFHKRRRKHSRKKNGHRQRHSKIQITKILSKDGKVIDGAESFLIIWKNVPKYNFLYKIFKIKPLFFILNIFYEIAAYFLFIKNKHLLNDEKS